MENLQNLAKFYHFEYQRALRLLEVEADRPSGISLLLELTSDPHLTLWWRLQVHSCLAAQLDHPQHAHEHLVAAESAFAEIVERWPPGTGHDAMYRSLAVFRTDMDDRKRELEEENRAANAANAAAEAAEADATASRQADAERAAGDPSNGEENQSHRADGTRTPDVGRPAADTGDSND